MKPLGDSTKHYWLAQRMAKITETDLAKAMQTADLTQADWANMVQECRGCTWVGKCETWLARQDAPASRTPSECVNHDRFAALKNALEDVSK